MFQHEFKTQSYGTEFTNNSYSSLDISQKRSRISGKPLNHLKIKKKASEQ